MIYLKNKSNVIATVDMLGYAWTDDIFIITVSSSKDGVILKRFDADGVDMNETHTLSEGINNLNYSWTQGVVNEFNLEY
jgi:hypothetical protein